MKSFEFTIRPAKGGDADNICDLLDEVAAEDIYILTEPGERTVGHIKGLLQKQSSNRNLLLVVDNYGDIVGVLGFIGGAFKKISHVAEIGMVIEKKFRSSGLGSTLLREAIAWARKRGFRRLELGVLSNNRQALSLYKKFGFKEEGVRKNRYQVDGEWVDEILMAKFL